MSTALAPPPSPLFPFTFEITGGPTFNTIGLTAMLCNVEGVDATIYCTGILTNVMTGSRRKTRLYASPYGFSSGSNYGIGQMTVDLTFEKYFLRLSSHIRYDFLNHRGLDVLELSEKPKKSKSE